MTKLTKLNAKVTQLRKSSSLWIFKAGKSLYVLALIVGEYSCSSYEYFKIEEISLNPTIEEQRELYQSRIDSTTDFIEDFVNAYLKVIETEAHPAFRDSFALSSESSISAKIIFSSVAECLIYLDRSDRNLLTIDLTSKYPVQMSLFSALELPGYKTKLEVPDNEAIDLYNNTIWGHFSLPSNGVVFIGGMTLITQNPKILNFKKNSIAVLRNITIEVRPKDKTLTTTIAGIGLFTGERDFVFAQDRAAKLGSQLAEHEISSLFLESDFFAAAMAYDRLRPAAERIKERRSRINKDADFEYPFWQFKQDVQFLVRSAKEFGFDTDFVDALLKDPNLTIHDGVLLTYYSTALSFMIQWASINLMLLLILVAAVILRRYRPSIRLSLVRKVSFVAVITAINAWVFYNKPLYLALKYWLIPGSLFLCCVFVTFKLSELIKDNDD